MRFSSGARLAAGTLVCWLLGLALAEAKVTSPSSFTRGAQEPATAPAGDASADAARTTSAEPAAENAISTPNASEPTPPPPIRFPRGASFAEAIEIAQPKIVKIHGAGGFRGLESYQSGFLISAEGHILTVWSYVLDTRYITVIFDDGSRYDAQVLGFDPRLELAVLKVQTSGSPHFDLDQSAESSAGGRVLAFSNLFGVATGDERASVQHGVVSALAPLEARRGAFETLYKGPVYILDAMTNNPGAPGGAVTDRQGRLVGMIGKESRNSISNTWLNYAIPIAELTPTVRQIIAGKFQADRPLESETPPEEPLDADALGLVLVPDVVERTPPFIDQIKPGSVAALAGAQADDLVLFVNDRMTPSLKSLVAELARLERGDPVKLTLIRGQESIEITLTAAPLTRAPKLESPTGAP